MREPLYGSLITDTQLTTLAVTGLNLRVVVITVRMGVQLEFLIVE
jgi:hypothetical protein